MPPPLSGSTYPCPCESGLPFNRCHGVAYERPSFHTHTDLTDTGTDWALQLVATGPIGSAEKFCVPAATATVIGPHLAITAKHVIADYSQQFGFPLDGSQEATCGLQAILLQPAQGVGIGIPVTKVTLCGRSDIAVLGLGSLPDDPPLDSWKVPILTLFPPSAGDVVVGVGYHDAVALESGSIQRQYSTTRGEVLNLFPEGRDRVMLPFPCFSIDARVKGGMSGGPVFNERGRLCGIFSSSFETDDPNGTHTSYVAALWPLITMSIDFGRVGQPPKMGLSARFDGSADAGTDARRSMISGGSRA